MNTQTATASDAAALISIWQQIWPPRHRTSYYTTHYFPERAVEQSLNLGAH